MKTIAILTAIMTLSLGAYAQNADHLKRNHKFHKHTEKHDQHTISSGIAALNPMELNRKFHMTKSEILPIPVQATGHSDYLVRNRKFRKTKAADVPVEKEFNNEFPNPPVLSSK